MCTLLHESDRKVGEWAGPMHERRVGKEEVGAAVSAFFIRTGGRCRTSGFRNPCELSQNAITQRNFEKVSRVTSDLRSGTARTYPLRWSAGPSKCQPQPCDRTLRQSDVAAAASRHLRGDVCVQPEART